MPLIVAIGIASVIYLLVTQYRGLAHAHRENDLPWPWEIQRLRANWRRALAVSRARRAAGGSFFEEDRLTLIVSIVVLLCFLVAAAYIVVALVTGPK
jgi:hypothetical protein